MKSKQNSGLLSLEKQYATKAHFSSYNSPELPPLFKELPAPNEPIFFTPEDISKVISHLLNKGAKYLQLKKDLDSHLASLLEQKLVQSSFLQFNVRKILNQMGYDKRVGAGLRGFNRFLLEQMQNKCWQMIQLQAKILLKEIQENDQRQKLNEVLALKPTFC